MTVFTTDEDYLTSRLLAYSSDCLLGGWGGFTTYATKRTSIYICLTDSRPLTSCLTTGSVEVGMPHTFATSTVNYSSST